MLNCFRAPLIRSIAVVGIVSASLAGGAMPTFAQTADFYPAICSLDMPADLYGSDTDVAASIAQTQADCQAATAPAS